MALANERAIAASHHADHAPSTDRHQECRCIGSACCSALGAPVPTAGAAVLLPAIGPRLVVRPVSREPERPATPFLHPFATAPPVSPADRYARSG